MGEGSQGEAPIVDTHGMEGTLFHFTALAFQYYNPVAGPPNSNYYHHVLARFLLGMIQIVLGLCYMTVLWYLCSILDADRDYNEIT